MNFITMKHLHDILHDELKRILLESSSNVNKSRFTDIYNSSSIKQNIPAKLYKYKFDDEPYKLLHLFENKLFSNYPKNFNDPLDCHKLKQFTKSLSNKTHPNTKLAISVLNEFRISSLSETGPRDKYSTLMWAHYAKNHSGICVEYNTVDIINSIKNITPKHQEDKSSMLSLMPVQYSVTPGVKMVH